MEILNRKSVPLSNEITQLELPPVKSELLSNGIRLYAVKGTEDEVLRVDFVFDAGVRFQTQGAVAPATSALLSEGTESMSSKELADAFDFYGAYFQTRCFADDAVVTLYCLKKNLPGCLPLLLDVFNNAAFPEKEVDLYRKNSIQRLLVSEQKNMFLARRAFNENIFGLTSPYGISSKSDDYAAISRENVQTFYQNFYKSRIKYIIAAGDVDLGVTAILNDSIGGNEIKKTYVVSSVTNEIPAHFKFIEQQNSVQSALRVGCKLFSRNHPDYQPMQVLNMVLGGYFGSRLMKNIREEKGLTYGIFSSIDSYRDSGAFYIETEINNELRETGLKEIKAELAVLRTTLIPAEELSLAKNYMLGGFLRSLDGPFSIADKYKTIIDYGLDSEYYSRFVTTIKHINAESLRELANKYLLENNLSTVVVGKQNG